MSEPDWKSIALWLASCHAATTEWDGNLKSTSKSRKDRLNRICERAEQAISGGYFDTNRVPKVDEVVDRLNRASEDVGR